MSFIRVLSFLCFKFPGLSFLLITQVEWSRGNFKYMTRATWRPHSSCHDPKCLSFGFPFPSPVTHTEPSTVLWSHPLLSCLCLCHYISVSTKGTKGFLCYPFRPNQLRCHLFHKALQDDSRIVILELWGCDSFRANQPFHRGHLTPSRYLYYITIHNGSKLRLQSSNENNDVVGGNHSISCIKGPSIRKAKNHYSGRKWPCLSLNSLSCQSQFSAYIITWI